MVAERYDHVVVGSGISGMTSALLLALNGKKVLLLEKSRTLGGSMARFRLNGIPFDTGFHFTGGFSPGGLLDEMLAVLGMREKVVPTFLTAEHANRFMFERSGRIYDFPAGEAKLKEQLKKDFPEEQCAIDEYFRLVEQVCAETLTMDLRRITASIALLDQDYESLEAVLDRLTGNRELKVLLAGFCMCYGSPPSQISFAAHARMVQGLYQSVARVERGGDAFIDAFKEAFQAHGVTIRLGDEIVECQGIEDGQVSRFRLASGETIAFESALFTTHPQEVLKLIPAENMRKAFVNRVSNFESSVGFFSVFGTFDCESEELGNSIISLFPYEDIGMMLKPDRQTDRALVIIRSAEEVDGRRVQAVTAFEPCYPDEIAQWADSSIGKRAPEYYAYKAEKEERIRQRVDRFFAEKCGPLKILKSASTLTFRDYLHSPDGSAYGVRQKVGQFNLIGKLPLRNLYVAGQSALLPGIVGAMMSSFIVSRALLDKDDFSNFICRRLNS
jgi:all-trans-retinol 13,14-reductase